ncbi:MAG: permease, partial [Clostridia bacterium]
IASLITLIFTFFKTNGVLFGFRDYDLLASLPISAGALISSRFFTMFVMNTASAAVLMIPMCVAHFIFVPPTAVSVVFWVVGILISSLIPTTVAAFFGAIVMYISSRFKRSNAVSVILTFVLIVAVMYASFSGSVGSAQMTMSDFARLSSDVYNKLCGIYPVARLFNDAIVAHDVLAFSLFLALSVLWYALFVRLVSLRYNAINSAHTARAALGNYKLKSLDIRSPLHALYKKEWKRFVGSPVYITNIGCGVIMAIILIAACMVFEPIKLEAMLNSPGLADIYMKILPFALAMILSMSCTTSCALSLEGKNLWILRTSPLPAKTVYDSKILVNLTILLPVAVVGSVLLSVRLHAD